MKYSFKVAVLGSGYMGKAHLENFAQLTKDLILCSNDVETGNELAEKFGARFYTDYSSMLAEEKPDITAVCLPTPLHYDATKCALENGSAVLCEKPFASNAQQAAELCSLAKEKGLLLMVAHVLRFMAAYEFLRRCKDDGRYGKLRYLNMYRHGGVPKWSVGNWLTKTELSGGVVKDLHVHDTDIIISLFGKPETVFTTGDYFACSTAFKYESGLSVNASAAWRSPTQTEPKVGFEAYFEDAVLTFNAGALTVYTGDEKDTAMLEREDLGEFFSVDKAKFCEVDYFCHCLEKGLSPEISPPEQTLLTMVTSDAELESLKLCREVEPKLEF